MMTKKMASIQNIFCANKNFCADVIKTKWRQFKFYLCEVETNDVIKTRWRLFKIIFLKYKVQSPKEKKIYPNFFFIRASTVAMVTSVHNSGSPC